MRRELPTIARLLLLSERSAATLERTSSCVSSRCITVGTIEAAPFAHAAVGRVFGRSSLVPRVVRFELSAQQAVRKFDDWQASHWLAPTSLLTSPDAQLTARLLPFWLFEAKVRVRYTGKLRRRQRQDGGSSSSERHGDVDGEWEQAPWREVPVRTYPWTRLAMQVYAGYELRPQLAQAAKFEGSVGRSRPLYQLPFGGGSSSSTGGSSIFFSGASSSGSIVGDDGGAASADGGYPLAPDWATVRARSDPAGGARGKGGATQPPPLRVELGAPEMRQAIAWEFALSAIREQEVAFATEALRRRAAGGGSSTSSSGGAGSGQGQAQPSHASSSAAAAGQGDEGLVRDVEVEVRVLRRRARLLYLPAFVVHYAFGQSHNAHGERQDDVFEAVIGGTPEAGVAGERHFCPRKAQLTAASALGLAGAAASAVAAPLLGLDAVSVLSVEGGFWVVLVGSLAGVAARLAPGMLRLSAENRRAEAEAAEFEAALQAGLGPMDVGDDRSENLRTAAEWRRWALADPQHWSPASRRAWAERLWREQQRRRRERARFVERLRAEAERQRAEGEREARRRARYGGEPHHERHHHGDGAHRHTGASFTRGSFGGGSGSPPRDALGYYRLLGLTPPGVGGPSGAGAARSSAYRANGGPGAGASSGEQQQQQLTPDDVKAAFRRAALRWHPDRLRGAAEADVARAREVFQQVQDAYNVLRDPELRRQYDAGRL